MRYRKKYASIVLLFILLAGSLGNSLIIDIWKSNSKFKEITPDIPRSTQGGTIVKGEVVMGTTDGYNWWSYVPMSLQKTDTAYILLEMSHSQIEDYVALTNDAKNNVMNWMSAAEENKYTIVTAVVPRNFTYGYYPQGINMHSLDPLTPEFYYRPDLKVNNIISELMNNLTDAGYSPYNRILVAGFSAGGMWSNRYTLLHPERVLAAAMGQAGGWLAMPLAEHNGSTLNWPMGVNNFYNLTGTAYNKHELLKNVSQFIFIGDQDTTSTYCEGYPSCQNITIWGETDPERLENQSKYLASNNYSVHFELYEGIGHAYTTYMKNDIFDFFETAIAVITETPSGNGDETIPSYILLVLLPITLISMIALALIHQKRTNFNRL
jgi:hypothetical protein